MTSRGTVAELGSGAFGHLEVPELDLAQNESCRNWVPPRSALLWPLYLSEFLEWCDVAVSGIALLQRLQQIITVRVAQVVAFFHFENDERKKLFYGQLPAQDESYDTSNNIRY